MADRISSEQRSTNMSRIRSTGSVPEMLVRRTVHSLGYRYRLHVRALPGTPDLVFSSRRKVIFVHGCFWHGHGCRVGGKGPKSNTSYWTPKIKRNQQRDQNAMEALQEAGWQTLVLWECELKDVPELAERLIAFLGPSIRRTPDG
ncbi:very short patch repair endonuclease [Rhizobium ruizarguesonis]|uniref:very short patch repair endonuclease n=1 Tax=Rhizobium ruizarguesonis TaxID=2081791 RepID=UPI001031520F|nr:very short patch repair endonuclease [Rhizobium ruizarguesonis]TBC11355.1 DNA mismatch endonuclease Vsr [Rhizobium ruizarguesonis]TBC59411.1 DNA mismatch endonuclease Vsr [Rhizobium ruizarguesonis]